MLLRSYGVGAMVATATAVAAMKKYSFSIDYFAYISLLPTAHAHLTDHNIWT